MPWLICTQETRRYLMNMRLDGPYGLFGWFWKRQNLLPMPGFKPWSVQPEASCYTDYAVQVSSIIKKIKFQKIFPMHPINKPPPPPPPPPKKK